MKKRIVLLFLTLLVLFGCEKQPAISGINDDEFYQYFSESYTRPMSNISEICSLRNGLILKSEQEEPIVAMQTGMVVYAKEIGWNYGYGKMALVQQDDCYLLYGHCAKLSVKTGDTVKAGEPIGTVGSTGDTDCFGLGVYRFPQEDVTLSTDTSGIVTGFIVAGEDPISIME